MWMTKENEGSLSTKEKRLIIEEFRKVNPSGIVVLTGGETMLKFDEFFELTNKCLELDLFCATNTNASLINENNLIKILEEGPKYLVISLDSHIREIHDYCRGIQGSYDHIISVIKKLVKLKKDKKYKSEIITNSVIFDRNIDYLKDFIQFVNDLEIDGCTFQILSRTFHKKGESDYFFENHFFKDKLKAIDKIQEVIDVVDNSKIIRTKKQDFEWMKLYIENPDFIGEQVCGSCEKNIMINCYGEIELCFNMKNINKGKSLGNIRDFDYNIGKIWDSEESNNVRKIMQNCRLNCGMLNCHRKR